jgi:zinc ribbon protein
VPDFCSCGAQLPADARFCHKCGKPQYEEPLFEETVNEQIPPPVAAPPAPTGPAEISFHNSAAVRAGFVSALLASLPIAVPVPAVLGFPWMLMWLLVSGFSAVWLYARRTGQFPTVRGGARMGWITGVFCFAIATVFFTINVIAVVNRTSLAEFYREQLGPRAAGDANMEKLLELLQSPAGLGITMLISLVFLFLFFTAIPTVGGAIGAKVLEKRHA